MKKVTVLVLSALCIWLMYQYPHTMLNPGELVEGHQELNAKCVSCHKPFWGIPNNKCISCHKLSDIGRDTLNLIDTGNSIEKIPFHNYLSNQKCTSCHTDHKGRRPDIPMNRFDHELLPQNVSSNCNSCHRQPLDTLHKKLSTACSNCHNTKDWKSVEGFNHEMIVSTDQNKCDLCHQMPKDTYHHLFKDNCDKCHTTAKWIPSTFDHSEHFQLDKDHNAKCNTCHFNNNFSVYTCYGCHEHSESNIMEEHKEEGIYNFANCTDCHKSADEHDIRMNGNNKKENNNELNNGEKNSRIKANDSKNEKEMKDEDD